jgi:hypothetical protein
MPDKSLFPHPEERALARVSKDGNEVHAAILRDAAKWPLLRMRAELDALSTLVIPGRRQEGASRNDGGYVDQFSGSRRRFSYLPTS